LVWSCIQPGKPNQNGIIERLNGTLRKECQNLNWFHSLDEVNELLEHWFKNFNFDRPHSHTPDNLNSKMSLMKLDTKTKFENQCKNLAIVFDNFQKNDDFSIYFCQFPNFHEIFLPNWKFASWKTSIFVEDKFDKKLKTN
jgi:Zn-finger protein